MGGKASKYGFLGDSEEKLIAMIVEKMVMTSLFTKLDRQHLDESMVLIKSRAFENSS